MSISILIPFRGTKSDKSRLRKDIDDVLVEKLLQKMLQYVISEVSQLKQEKKIYLLTKTESIEFQGNFEIIEDRGENLNDSLVKAFKSIQEEIIIIVMADLPLLKTEDVERVIIEVKQNHKIILAPTFDNGTSILGFYKDMLFPLLFGDNSAKKFQKMFLEKDIENKLLTYSDRYKDIDTFKDLIELKRNNILPDWLAEII